MKNRILYWLFLGLLISCTHLPKPADSTEVSAINDCFLNIVDTFGYRYHTLRPSLQDSTFSKPDSLTIGVFDQLLNVSEWQKSILTVLNTLPDSTLKKSFIDLFKKSRRDTAQEKLNPSSITNTGKYLVSAVDDRDTKHIRHAIGMIAFSRVYYDNTSNIALLVAEIRGNTFKSGVDKLFLLKKSGKGWIKAVDFDLEIW